MKPRPEPTLPLLLACLLAACQGVTPVPPLRAPPRVALAQVPGALVTREPPAATGTDQASAPARFAHVELVRFPRRPARDLPRLVDRLRAVLAEDGRAALRPASLWWGDAQLDVPDALWTSLPATGLFAGLLAWRAGERLELRVDASAPPALVLVLTPGAEPDRWELALHVRGPAPAPAVALDDDRAAAAGRLGLLAPRAEDLLFQPLPATPDEPLALVLPSPWDDGWLGLRVTPAEPDAAAAGAALAARERRLAAPGAAPSQPAAMLPAADLRAVLREGLARRASRRATLHHAGRAVRLTLLAELALVAPDPLLDAVSARVEERLAAGAPVDLPTLLGALLAGLADTLLDPAAAAPVDAVLAEHLGALDRRRDMLSDALPQLVDPAALQALLRRENRLLLEDPRPATRVRAWLWLHRRDLAPAGYDPLAPRAERRAALAAAEEPAP